jgi:phosphoribosylanthranilate isomerase
VSRVWIKICGLTDRAAVEAAAEAGADAVGFVFHSASPRHLEPAAAAALAAQVPGGIARVAVFLHPTQADVDAALAAVEPHYVQTDAADFDYLRLPPGLRALPVLRSGAATASALPGRFVFEAAHSGAGHRADWEAARMLATRGELVLGGGLDAGNVAAAIRAVAPFGVDVSSGVERERGRKDPRLVMAFVAAARVAAATRIEDRSA